MLRFTKYIFSVLFFSVSVVVAGQQPVVSATPDTLAVTSERVKTVVQFRSNLLYDLALCPTIGVEVQLPRGFAWQLDYTGAWWNNDSRHRYYSNYGFQTEFRYYFDQEENEPHQSHHVGLYGQLFTYDFEFGHRGRMSRWLDDNFGIGVSYGYVKALGRHCSLDFVLGLGYIQSTYDEYIPMDGFYCKTATKKWRFIGPTKAEITLVWSLNANNNSNKR